MIYPTVNGALMLDVYIFVFVCVRAYMYGCVRVYACVNALHDCVCIYLCVYVCVEREKGGGGRGGGRRERERERERGDCCFLLYNLFVLQELGFFLLCVISHVCVDETKCVHF